MQLEIGKLCLGIEYQEYKNYAQFMGRSELVQPYAGQLQDQLVQLRQLDPGVEGEQELNVYQLAQLLLKLEEKICWSGQLFQL